MEKPVKAGIIGLGTAGRLHLQPMKKLTDLVEVAALCDTDEKVLKKTARKYKNAKTYTNHLDLLENDEIEAVHILLPHHLHERIVIDCAKAKKHILCEKPIAITLEEVDNMIAAVNKAGVKLLVAENQLFLPAHIKMKELLDEGVVGEIKLIRCFEAGSEIASMSDPTTWKCSWEEGGGGCWMDSGVHHLALLHYLIGGVKGISGTAENLFACEEKADDNCCFTLKFEHGAIGQIGISFSSAADWDQSTEIYGTDGTILENHNWIKPIKYMSKKPGPHQSEWIEPEVVHRPYPGYYGLSFGEEIKAFYNHLFEGTPYIATPEFVRKDLEVVLAGYEAVKQKKWIYL